MLEKGLRLDRVLLAKVLWEIRAHSKADHQAKHTRLEIKAIIVVTHLTNVRNQTIFRTMIL